MCGLAGIVDPALTGGAGDRALARMLGVLAHRGPDGEGTHVAPEAPLFLGHRRLAIIDPANGRQPMSTEDGELTVVFNGAIYNYLELRRELVGCGHAAKTYSDTEVILHAYAEWGVECVQRFNGMFAFALWDRSRRRLFCARDRLGIKPFYYIHDGRRLGFASEIKALFAGGLVRPELNARGLQDYLHFQYCLGDKTMFAGIHRLEPGWMMVANLGRDGVEGLRLSQYWDLDYTINTRHDAPWIVDRLQSLMEDAIRLQLRSDVPVGAHLSGGLDSSAVVSIAASLAQGEILKTFTGAFLEGPEFDETPYARAVADEVGAEYHEVFISGGGFPDLMPRLIWHMDEPAAGPGLYSQYFVSELASRHVRVVLGGQGGDELFVGYARYLVAYLEQCLAGAINETAEDRFAVTLDSIIPNLPVLREYTPMLQRAWGNQLFCDGGHRYFTLIDRSEGMAGLLDPGGFDRHYSPYDAFRQVFDRPGISSLINRMTNFDIKTSLPALLQVEDRTSMAVGLESRVPLLDHRIAELMASVAPNVKFQGGRLKAVFRDAVANSVPKAAWNRKDKKGFPTPLQHWVAGAEAGDFVRDLLLSPQARSRGLYRMDVLDAAVSSQGKFSRVVWGLLCLELWHRVFIDQGARAGGQP